MISMFQRSLILTIAFAASTNAQTMTNARSLHNGSARPATIDGKFTPQLVPDHIAYSLFFQTLLQSKGEDVQQYQHRVSQIEKQVGLAGSDSGAFENAIASFRDVMAARRPLARIDAQAQRDAQASREAFIQGLISTLHSEVSDSGMLRLGGFIEREVKSHVKYFDLK